MLRLTVAYYVRLKDEIMFDIDNMNPSGVPVIDF